MNDFGFTPLTTERLTLRRLAAADLQPFLAYRNDPLVARYQSWVTWSEEEAWHLFAVQESLLPGRPGHWFQVAVELRETGELVGDCAFCVEPEDPSRAEIGFTFARAFQKRGYAFESVSALLPYFFSTLGLHRLIARTDSENHPAHALLERLGFRREGTERVWFKGAWGGEDCYVLDRAPVPTAN